MTEEVKGGDLRHRGSKAQQYREGWNGEQLDFRQGCFYDIAKCLEAILKTLECHA